MNKPFISICILSYNRPELLERLLNGLEIDQIPSEEFEVVVCEDYSPKRDQIAQVISDYKDRVNFKVTLFHNKQNLGYDGTFVQVSKLAEGQWLIYMGDDDEFVPNSIIKIYEFLKKGVDLDYVLKSHLLIHENGLIEPFKYFKETTYFDAGVDAYIKLFRRSVYIGGFIIRNSKIRNFLDNRFDGTELTQLHLLAEAVLNGKSAYLDIPFTQQYASHEHNLNDVMFNRKKGIFVPRKPTIENSINFLSSFEKITKYIDEKYNLESTLVIKKQMSKYFYHSLSVHRNNGVSYFLKYVIELNKLGFNISIHYRIYILGLLFLGKRNCDKLIYIIKKILGRTPEL